ncbi:urease accessory protein UreD [Thalassobaculum sp. OXR-137]|uniref:urease accessory protein UreD n=1 Tax=Thalassobaculum sp. OXR-137 TaxID=3100173 RepID=UPI002AC937CE|nr:urease accessory protein UreD [Thalassobaculum sp. OXR-137]WPZ34815.1 urease accessory protein UreD [Thalassobaculum sp. OXR-137]
MPVTARKEALQRYAGALEVSVGSGRVLRSYYTPPMRLFRPYGEGGEPRTFVVANVAGGVVGGDRLSVSLDVGADEALLATTQAAEKVYRSDGAEAVLTNSYRVGPGAVLEMLSSGTILFDGSRLLRSTEIDVAAGGRFAYAETVVLGRIARGEVFASGSLKDRIRLRRDGRLVWADDFGLDGDIAGTMAAAAGLDGAKALAMLLLVGEGAGQAVEIARAQAPVDGLRIGASALSGDCVAVRILAGDPAAARTALAAIWSATRSAWLNRPARMPVIWSV